MFDVKVPKNTRHGPVRGGQVAQLGRSGCSVEPIEVPLLQLALVKAVFIAVGEQQEPPCVLHVVVEGLHQDGDATMSSRV